MAKVNSNYRKNIKAFRKLVNGPIKPSVKNRIETLADGSGNSFSKLHYEKLGSELDMKSFEDTSKEEVSNSVKLFATCLSRIQIPMECLINQ